MDTVLYRFVLVVTIWIVVNYRLLGTILVVGFGFFELMIQYKG